MLNESVSLNRFRVGSETGYIRFRPIADIHQISELLQFCKIL